MNRINNPFRKKNRGEIGNSIHRENVVDIPTYGPHDNILPKPYEAGDLFSYFEADFETLCKEFLNNTELDQFNRGYMDTMIDQMVKDAVDLLVLQEIEHRTAINQLVYTRISDIADAEARLSQIPSERDRIISELELLEGIYYSGTAFEEFRRQ